MHASPKTDHGYELATAAQRMRTATEERDEAIRAAYLGGLSVIDIAYAVQLSRQRVYVILRERGTLAS